MLDNIIALRWIGFSALALAAGRPLPAQPDPLGHLVREAWAHNRTLQQTRLAVQEHEADVRQARARYFPTLDLDARWTEQSGGLDLSDAINPAYAALNQLLGEDRFPTGLDLRLPQRQDMRLRLVQPVFDYGISAGHALARSRRNAAGERHAASELDIAAAVQLTYLQYAGAARSLQILESARELLDENLRVSERLVTAGTSTPDAVARARADRADVLQRLADAAQRRDAAVRDLNQLLGRRLDAPADLVSDSLLVFPLDSAPGPLIERALRNRPELREAAAAIDAARAATALATAGMLPSLIVALDYGFTGSDLRFGRRNDVALATVALKWNLFRGGQDAARREGARLARERLEAARADLEQTIVRQVRTAWEAARVAREAIATAGERLAAAGRTFELVRRRYEEGLASHLEFTQARSDYTSAGLNELLTRYACAARIVELERAAALRSTGGDER